MDEWLQVRSCPYWSLRLAIIKLSGFTLLSLEESFVGCYLSGCYILIDCHFQHCLVYCPVFRSWGALSFPNSLFITLWIHHRRVQILTFKHQTCCKLQSSQFSELTKQRLKKQSQKSVGTLEPMGSGNGHRGPKCSPNSPVCGFSREGSVLCPYLFVCPPLCTGCTGWARSDASWFQWCTSQMADGLAC